MIALRSPALWRDYKVNGGAYFLLWQIETEAATKTKSLTKAIASYDAAVAALPSDLDADVAAGLFQEYIENIKAIIVADRTGPTAEQWKTKARTLINQAIKFAPQGSKDTWNRLFNRDPQSVNRAVGSCRGARAVRVDGIGALCQARQGLAAPASTADRPANYLQSPHGRCLRRQWRASAAVQLSPLRQHLAVGKVSRAG